MHIFVIFSCCIRCVILPTVFVVDERRWRHSRDLRVRKAKSDRSYVKNLNPATTILVKSIVLPLAHTTYEQLYRFEPFRSVVKLSGARYCYNLSLVVRCMYHSTEFFLNKIFIIAVHSIEGLRRRVRFIA